MLSQLRTLPRLLSNHGKSITPMNKTFSGAKSLRQKSDFSVADSILNETQLQLKETVNKFAQERISPIAAQVDKDNEFPMHMWKEMGEMGFLGVTAPP